MNYEITVITGKTHSRRGVAFLISDDKRDNAYKFYFGLRQNDVTRRMFNTRFDNWRDGQPNKPHRYHGWDKSEFSGHYVQCFVFKHNKDRFYGFLCNPKDTSPRYQLCVLVCHAKKKEHESDTTELKYVELKRMDFTIQKKIKDFFKEK